MKLPAWGMQSMLLSDSPNGLMPSMQAPWAKYFSKFITAYKKHGIDLWGVTRPERAGGGRRVGGVLMDAQVYGELCAIIWIRR